MIEPTIIGALYLHHRFTMFWRASVKMYAVIPEHTKNMPTPIGEFQPNRFFIVSKSTSLSASFNYMTGIIKQYWVSFKIEKHLLLFVKCVGNFLQ